MIKPVDFSPHTLWLTLKREAGDVCNTEPVLADVMRTVVLEAQDFSAALVRLLSRKLAHYNCSQTTLAQVFTDCLTVYPDIAEDAFSDLAAVLQRDPAATSTIDAFMYFKGYHALQTHRMAHRLWQEERKHLACYMQSRVSECFSVDIHPAAKIGHGVMLDHATGIVIGETSVIGNNVSILHNVTLGGTGNDTGDRHPKIGHGVLIGAGAKILGNISVGDGALIAAGSVVLKDVAPHVTVAGVPAKQIGDVRNQEPAVDMDQISWCKFDL